MKSISQQIFETPLTSFRMAARMMGADVKSCDDKNDEDDKSDDDDKDGLPYFLTAPWMMPCWPIAWAMGCSKKDRSEKSNSKDDDDRNEDSCCSGRNWSHSSKDWNNPWMAPMLPFAFPFACMEAVSRSLRGGSSCDDDDRKDKNCTSGKGEEEKSFFPSNALTTPWMWPLAPVALPMAAASRMFRGERDSDSADGSNNEFDTIMAASGKATEMMGQYLNPVEMLGYATDFLDPKKMAELGKSAFERAAESARIMADIDDASAAMKELQNKSDVFFLVLGAAHRIGVPSKPDVPFPLKKYVGKAYDLGTYDALWGVEGLGHEYGDSFWDRDKEPCGILNQEAVADVPKKAMPMLAAGVGLSFAQHNLEDLPWDVSEHKLRKEVTKTILLCRNNVRPEFRGAAYESLGLYTRNFKHKLTSRVDDVLESLNLEDDDPRGFYWHGVGRALYFWPCNWAPGSDWQAFEMAKREAPNERAYRNAVSGLAWAFTMVNIQNPEVIARLLLKHHGKALAEDDAFTNGVVSAIIVRKNTTPKASFIDKFINFQPSGSMTRDRWNKLIKIPARKALDDLYDDLESTGRLGEVFEYQNLEQLAAR